MPSPRLTSHKNDSKFRDRRSDNMSSSRDANTTAWRGLEKCYCRDTRRHCSHDLKQACFRGKNRVCAYCIYQLKEIVCRLRYYSRIYMMLRGVLLYVRCGAALQSKLQRRSSWDRTVQVMCASLAVSCTTYAGRRYRWLFKVCIIELSTTNVRTTVNTSSRFPRTELEIDVTVKIQDYRYPSTLR